MMRFLKAVSLAMVASLLMFSNLRAQSFVACGAPNASGNAEAAGMRQLISGSSASDSAWRARASLPKMAASAVVFVTSDSLCDVAARAVANLSTPPAPVQPVWVLSVGPDRYIVYGAGRMRDGWLLAAVFDGSFTWIADFLE
jgi:hypothetical protein